MTQACVNGKRLQSLSIMILLVASIKYSDLHWLDQERNLFAHLTDDLEASHAPGLVDSVALSVIMDLILSGPWAYHP